MDSLVVEDSPSESPARNLNVVGLLAAVSLGLCLCAFVLVGIGYWLVAPALGKAPWAGVALLGLAAASTLISLARRLPWQNVVLGAVLIALSGTAVEVVLISTGRGLGFSPSRQMAEPSFWLPKLWQLPLVWIIALLNCRGVVRLGLRRWRSVASYGFWVLGGTAVSATIFILAFAELGPVAMEWRATTTVLACAVGTLIALVLVTPSLINKKPVSQPADWHPLVIWVGFNLWFVVDAFGQGRWIVAGLILSEISAVALLVLRGRGTHVLDPHQGEAR